MKPIPFLAAMLALALAVMGAAPARCEDTREALRALQEGRGPSAVSVKEIARAAEAAYEEGRYEDAFAGWSALLKQGMADADLYYNLGCAAYRAGRNGMAAWAFEQALLLKPSHVQALANRAYLREEHIGEPEMGGLDAFLDALHRALPAGAMDWLLALSLWGMPLGWVLHEKRRHLSRACWIIFTAGVLVLGSCSAALHYYAGWSPRAMTVANTPLLSAPRSGAPALMPLAAGTYVHLGERRGEWVMLRLPDGKIGWAAPEALRRLGRRVGSGSLS